MKILVTGINGFLGSSIARCISNDHDVMAVVRNDQIQADGNGSVKFIIGDLANPSLFLDQIQDFSPDCCLHLAWEGLPDYSLDKCRINLDYGIRLISALYSIGVNRIVVSGTCWEYGNISGLVREDMSSGELSIFGASKRSLYEILKSSATQIGAEYRWGRVFFAYGPGQRSTSLIPNIRSLILNGEDIKVRDPSAMHDFIYVDDVARGLIDLCAEEMSSGIYNLGSGRLASVASVVNMVADHYGVATPYKNINSDHVGMGANVDKLQNYSSWTPHTRLEDGVRFTLEQLDLGSLRN